MTKHKNSISINTLITALVVLTASGYVLVNSYKALSRTSFEDGWKVTQGTILSPDLTLKGKKNIERKTQGLEQTVNYEYEIDGVTYRSNAVSKKTYVLLDDFPEHKVVDVYYNPENTADTVLVRSTIQKQYLYVMISFCVLIISVVFYFLIRDFRNS